MTQYLEVAQADEWGCAAACVASLVGASYDQALKWLEHEKGKRADQRPKGFEIDEIAHALFAQGVKVVADWYPPDSIPEGSILCIHGPGRYQYYHYVLKVPGGYMDPWVDLEPGRMKASIRTSLPGETSVYVALLRTS